MNDTSGFQALDAQQSSASAQPVSSDAGTVPAGNQQERAQAEVNRMRADFKDAPAGERDTYLQRMTKLSRFAQGYGPKPDDFEPEPVKAPDLRPYDPERAELERQAQPVQDHEIESLLTKASVKGVPPDAAKDLVTCMQVVGLPRDDIAALIERAAAHYSADPVIGEVADYRTPLSESEAQEYIEVAAKALGGVERLQEISETVRAFLSSKRGPSGVSVMDALDEAGISSSSIALDPRALMVLYHAAKRGRG